MDWDQLHYFNVLAGTKSFTKASEELNLSQPALSRSISRLEEEVGLPLFDRKSRGVVLNEYGKVFLEHANRAISEISEGKQIVNDMVDPYRGAISIAFIQTLGSSFVPDLISKYKEKYPDIQIQLSQNITSKILDEVETGKTNIGFCSPKEPIEQLFSIPVLEEELFLIVPASHPLANRKEVNLNEVAEDPFVLFKQGTALHGLIHNLCSEAGFTPKKVFEGFEERTVTDLVEANFGVAIIPWLPYFDKRKISVLRINQPKSLRTIQMVWKNSGYISPTVKNFLEFIKAYVHKAD